MINEIVLATRNRHKISELKDILSGLHIKISSLAEYPDMPEVLEDGKTLEENAAKKAREIALHLKKWALADDTGLEVEFLNGEPGVYSARWAGPGCTYEDNNKKLLSLLKGVPDEKRRAFFRAVIAISDPDGKTRMVDGKINGRISREIRGAGGFGYDPLFFVPELNKTFAELTAEEKNKISHRARALQKAKEIIKGLVGA